MAASSSHSAGNLRPRTLPQSVFTEIQFFNSLEETFRKIDESVSDIAKRVAEPTYSTQEEMQDIISKLQARIDSEMAEVSEMKSNLHSNMALDMLVRDAEKFAAEEEIRIKRWEKKLEEQGYKPLPTPQKKDADVQVSRCATPEFESASKQMSRADVEAAKAAACTPALPATNSSRKNSLHQFTSPARPSTHLSGVHLGRTPQAADFGIAEDLAEALVRYFLTFLFK